MFTSTFIVVSRACTNLLRRQCIAGLANRMSPALVPLQVLIGQRCIEFAGCLCTFLLSPLRRDKDQREEILTEVVQ